MCLAQEGTKKGRKKVQSKRRICAPPEREDSVRIFVFPAGPSACPASTTGEFGKGSNPSFSHLAHRYDEKRKRAAAAPGLAPFRWQEKKSLFFVLNHTLTITLTTHEEPTHGLGGIPLLPARAPPNALMSDVRRRKFRKSVDPSCRRFTRPAIRLYLRFNL